MNVDGVSSHSCNMQKNSSCFFLFFFPSLVLFPSLTQNQSFLIYQGGFVSRCLIQIPIRKRRGGGGGGVGWGGARIKGAMQICWLMRLVLETKSGLTWIDTEHKIILGWIWCAWLYLQRSFFLFLQCSFSVFGLFVVVVFFFLLTWKILFSNIIFPEQRRFFARGTFQGPDLNVST